MSDLTPNLPAVDPMDISYKEVKRKLLVGEALPDRKRRWDEKGKFANTSPEQKKLSKHVSDIKYTQSTTRAAVKTAMYANLYAALGYEPTRKKESGVAATGINLTELLCEMLSMMTTRDNCTFKVGQVQGRAYTITKVGAYRGLCCRIRGGEIRVPKSRYDETRDFLVLSKNA